MSILNTEDQPQIDDNLKAEDEVHCYQFDVKMSCTGCSGAVGRALDKTPGVIKRNIDIRTQIVEVLTTLPYDDVLATIKKTGKEVVDGKELPVLPEDVTD